MLSKQYNHKIGLSDAGHYGSGQLGDGVTLDVPSFPSILLRIELLYIIRSQPRMKNIPTGIHHLHQQQP